MKKLVYIFGLLMMLISCSQKKELTLLERVDDFTISECRDNCSIDSVGIRRNEIENNDLYLRFGYFLNCSWEEGYIETIERQNDTMIIHIDRPHEIDTVVVESGNIITEEITHEYPITSCDCFFFFNVKINAVEKPPKVIRVAQKADRVKFWDEAKNSKPQYNESEGVFDLNEPPIKIKKIVLNTELFDVTSGITDAKYLDSFCKFKDYHLERNYNLVSKIKDETFSYLKVYVKDDKYKMSRRYANEVFQSIDINYKYLKVWSTFRVGMTLDDLMGYISAEEYHSDFGKVVVYSKEFKSEFFHENSVVTRIVIQRRCED